jgi:RNA polymerase sigma-70 factor (sigma-E family)
VTAADSGVPGRPLAGPQAPAVNETGTDREAAGALCALYAARYRPLVQLAALLVGDMATAEEVVQDSFIAMHANWRRLHDIDKAAAYLRQCVINRSRSVLRHRRVVDRNVPRQPPGPSAEESAIQLFERSAVVAALRRLSPRQRQALVLRYYAELSEAQIASAMGISRGAVKSHISRAMAALRDVLEGEHEPARS